MPVVPMTPTGPRPSAMPSESNLLMALSEMDKQGRFQVAQQASPEQEEQWKAEGWDKGWDHAVPYGGAGGNNQSKMDAIKQYPDMEFIDMPGAPKGGTLYFRAKSKGALVS